MHLNEVDIDLLLAVLNDHINYGAEFYVGGSIMFPSERL